MRLALAKLLSAEAQPAVCWMSPPTISIWKHATGWKNICTIIRMLSCSSRTTAIFSTWWSTRSRKSGTSGSGFTPATTTSFLTQKTARNEQLQAAYKNQRDRIEQLEVFINRFRYQATKAKQVQSRIKELEKIERIEVPPEEKTIHFSFPQPKPSGRIVAEFVDVAKSYRPSLLASKKTAKKRSSATSTSSSSAATASLWSASTERASRH